MADVTGGSEPMEVEETVASEVVDANETSPAIDPMASASETTPEPEMIEPVVNDQFQGQLEDMGFGHNQSIRALHFSGNSTLEGAINWLEQHTEDTDLEEPLMVPNTPQTDKSSKKLSPEEAKVKALELQARAKAKREAAEKDSEKDREKLRIRMGKELAAVARIEEDQKMKRVADERIRAKQEEAAAKNKIRLKVEEDRKERRRKAGLPEELTEEEKAEDEKRRIARGEEESKQKLNIIRPVSVIAAMREILVTMKKETPDQVKFQTCCKTLNAYCRNVFLNIEDPAKRRIKLENKALQERVLPLTGGLEFLEQVGFQKLEAEGVLEMQKKDTAFEQAVLKGAADVLDSAMNNPMFGIL